MRRSARTNAPGNVVARKYATVYTTQLQSHSRQHVRSHQATGLLGENTTKVCTRQCASRKTDAGDRGRPRPDTARFLKKNPAPFRPAPCWRARRRLVGPDVHRIHLQHFYKANVTQQGSAWLRYTFEHVENCGDSAGHFTVRELDKPSRFK